MKILVTGAAGMLGSDLCPEMERNGIRVIRTDIRLTPNVTVKMDVTKPDNIQAVLDEHNVDWVFHLAAETDVDFCEKEPDHAFRTNAIGTENIALACQERDIPVGYISTAAVFNGKKPEPYTEFDRPDPVSIYGRSKLEGEKAVATFLNRFFIFRAGWMFGGWGIDKKFVFKIVNLLRERDRIRVVNDKYGSPTFTSDFSRNLVALWKTSRYGLYHLVNRGVTSRYKIACQIARFMGVEKKVEILPVRSAYFPLPAPRTRSEMMVNSKLDVLGRNDMPRWEDSLKQYIMENVNQTKKRRALSAVGSA